MQHFQKHTTIDDDDSQEEPLNFYPTLNLHFARRSHYTTTTTTIRRGGSCFFVAFSRASLCGCCWIPFPPTQRKEFLSPKKGGIRKNLSQHSPHYGRVGLGEDSVCDSVSGSEKGVRNIWRGEENGSSRRRPSSSLSVSRWDFGWICGRRKDKRWNSTRDIIKILLTVSSNLVILYRYNLF